MTLTFKYLRFICLLCFVLSGSASASKLNFVLHFDSDLSDLSFEVLTEEDARAAVLEDAKTAVPTGLIPGKLSLFMSKPSELNRQDGVRSHSSSYGDNPQRRILGSNDGAIDYKLAYYALEGGETSALCPCCGESQLEVYKSVTYTPSHTRYFLRPGDDSNIQSFIVIRQQHLPSYDVLCPVGDWPTAIVPFSTFINSDTTVDFAKTHVFIENFPVIELTGRHAQYLGFQEMRIIPFISGYSRIDSDSDAGEPEHRIILQGRGLRADRQYEPIEVTAQLHLNNSGEPDRVSFELNNSAQFTMTLEDHGITASQPHTATDSHHQDVEREEYETQILTMHFGDEPPSEDDQASNSAHQEPEREEYETQTLTMQFGDESPSEDNQSGNQTSEDNQSGNQTSAAIQPPLPNEDNRVQSQFYFYFPGSSAPK